MNGKCNVEWNNNNNNDNNNNNNNDDDNNNNKCIRWCLYENKWG